MLNSNKYYKITKIIITISITIFAAWLFDKNFTPRGKLVLSYNFNREKTPFLKFKGLSESEKTFSEKKWYRRILTSPVEIEINLPRPYKKAKIYLEYQNSAFPLLYLTTFRKTKDFWGEEIRTLENKILDEIPWYAIKDKNRQIILLQKGKDKCKRKIKSNTNKKSLEYEECLYNYSKDKDPEELLKLGNQEKKPWMEYQFENIDEFLKNVTEVLKKQKIATFNFDLFPYLKINDYQAEDKIKVFDKTLRGNHKILTYIKNEPLNFTFYFQDLNRQKGKDLFGIIVKQKNKIFAKKGIGDDGIIKGNNKKTKERKLEIKIPNLQEGFYQLEFNTTSDIIINKIETSQKFFGFKNHLNLFRPDQNIEFYTDATNINFSPKHKIGLNQEIKTKPQKFSFLKDNSKSVISKTLKIKKLSQYSTNLVRINKITTQKNDIAIDFEGIAVFSPEIFEKVNLKNLNSLLDSTVLNNLETVDYILTTSYNPPKQISKSGWKKQEVEFNLSELGLNPFKPKLNLFLNIPKFNCDNNCDNENNYKKYICSDIKLRKIKIILEKDPWSLEYLKNVLKLKFEKIKKNKKLK